MANLDVEKCQRQSSSRTHQQHYEDSFPPAEGVDGRGGRLEVDPFPCPEVIFSTHPPVSCTPALLPGWRRLC